MPRRSRVVVPGVPFHLIQRGNNRLPCFNTEADYRFYLANLYEQANKHGCMIHAYCLMTNHAHLLVTPTTPESLGQMMKGVGQRYVPYFNRTYERTGTLWEGRFRSCLIKDEAYVLACYRYIELNPVRAGMVSDPARYRWSSHRFNGYGTPNALCTPHQLYQALGTNDEARLEAYRKLVRLALEPGVIQRLRAATNGNLALGSTRPAKNRGQTPVSPKQVSVPAVPTYLSAGNTRDTATDSTASSASSRLSIRASISAENRHADTPARNVT